MSMFKQWVRHIVKRGQVGQSIIILALGMIGLIGFVGLTTDVSILFVRYNNLRRAVDSAAIAAAGQVRQTGQGEFSDVIARASLSARQFIEFHGLNPRDVWVEMCENQPRRDFDPTQEGIQMEPPAIGALREEYGVMIATLNAMMDSGESQVIIDEARDNVQDARQAYIDGLLDFASDEGMTIETPSTAYDDALQAWESDNSNANWAALMGASNTYIGQLREEVDILGDDEGVCSPDVRKLVRVTAQIDSPTVFLRLLGWEDITLQASATSETAVLDVVLVMDVSESMLFETNYQDWAEVNLGMGYVPPYIMDISNETASYSVAGQLVQAGFLPIDPNNSSRIYRFVMDSERAANNPPVDGWLWGTNVNVAGGDPDNISGRAGTWFEWFWLEYMLGEWQQTVNNRLNFLAPDGSNADGLTPVSDPREQYETARDRPSAQFNVRSFVPSGVTAQQANHPRPECRVRFFPYSQVLNMTQNWPRIVDDHADSPRTMAQFYIDEGMLNAGNWPNINNFNNENATQPRWGGFVPTYNFYGCCNDPASGIFISDGTSVYVDANTGDIIPNGEYVVNVANVGEPPSYERLGNRVPRREDDTWSPDWNFSDLVCQPFKQARDATRQFLQRIDFLRGDRVAFVTFDRSAHLIDPDFAGTGQAHMIESYEVAVSTLNTVIGVRAEPNFYTWDEDTARWTGFAAGIDPETGESIPLDYGTAGEFNENLNAAVNYPVLENCFIQNALLRYPHSIYATRNVPPPADQFASGIPRSVALPSSFITTRQAAEDHFDVPGYRVGDAAMLRNINPPYGSPEWQTQLANLNLSDRFASPDTTLQSSYERHGMCNGGNIGAALREASSALNDPRTSRRDGSVWIIIVLSDGSAGRSDAVRSQGSKIRAYDPYFEIESFDFRQRLAAGLDAELGPWENRTDPAQVRQVLLDTDRDMGGYTNLFGSSPGEYGAYGLCPYGFIGPGGPARIGNLVTGDPSAFPWCSKPDPFARHFCIDDGRAVGYSISNPNEIGLDPAPNSFGPGFQPNAIDRDYRPLIADSMDQYNNQGSPPRYVRPMPPDYPFNESQWIADENERLGNFFEVDIGDYNDPNNPCDPLYDPFDYARDWADYIAGVDEDESSTAQLPIIFTIGFGLNFNLGDGSCAANIRDCLGEELLRYIADAGDNFRIDNDVHRDMRHNREQWRNNAGADYPTLDGSIDNDPDFDWGPKDPCEPDFYGGDPSKEFWRPNDPDNPTTIADLRTRTPGESCGNYYNAPGLSELQRVFDEIASRMFTRLSG
ncbi:MAG: hypothetical protein EA396_07210 [Anaerolineaceae bacterium]|nr:MAG: hypothetical protein EA396_07210 [Anaerolineaceae bacterium]